MNGALWLEGEGEDPTGNFQSTWKAEGELLIPSRNPQQRAGIIPIPGYPAGLEARQVQCRPRSGLGTSQTGSSGPAALRHRAPGDPAHPREQPRPLPSASSKKKILLVGTEFPNGGKTHGKLELNPWGASDRDHPFPEAPGNGNLEPGGRAKIPEASRVG